MAKVTDIDTRRTNREIMDIEVRFDRNNKVKTRKIFKEIDTKLWTPGDEPGDLGFPEGNEYD